jgi:hypothetical protein
MHTALSIHPPQGPDLSVAAFFLFPELKVCLKGQRLVSTEGNARRNAGTAIPYFFKIIRGMLEKMESH